MFSEIEGKINLRQALLYIVFGFLFFGFIGALLFFRGITNFNNGNSFLKTVLPVSIFPLIASLYSLFFFFKNFPGINISSEGIEFRGVLKSIFYSWSEVKEIKLTEKVPMKFFFISAPKEATLFILNDNSTKRIWADNYSNMPLLRRGLREINRYLSNRQPVPIDFFDEQRLQVAKNSEEFEDELYFEQYKGNAWVSINTLLLIGWLVFVIFAVSKAPDVFLKSGGAIFSLSFSIIVLLGLAVYQLHFFVLTNKRIIVKNHMWPWYAKEYPLAEIEEVVLESPPKLSYSLRIIDNEFNSKIFPAGSLKDETWKRLLNELKKKNIKVRSEILL